MKRLDNFIANFIYDISTSSKYDFINIRWAIKVIAYRLKLYKTNCSIEKECLEQAIKRRKLQ